MMAAIDTYLAVRRAVGFTLSNTEYLLRSFAAVRCRSSASTYPHRNCHRLGQSSGIGCATAHSLPDRLPFCATTFAWKTLGTNCRRRTTSATSKTRRVPHIYSAIEIRSSDPGRRRSFRQPTHCGRRRMRR